MSRNPIPIEHKRLIIGCPTFDAFVTKYQQSPLFKEVNPLHFGGRVRKMWQHREELIHEVNLYDIEKEKLDNVIMIPRLIKKPALGKSLSDTSKDGEGMNTAILNELRYMNVLIAEQNALLTKLVKKVYPDYEATPLHKKDEGVAGASVAIVDPVAKV